MCATGTLLHSSAVSRHPTASTDVVAGRDLIATRVLSAAVLMPSPSPGQAPTTAVPSRAAHGPVLSKNCVTCHNDRVKTGGFVLDVSSLESVGAAAESWERVVRKLRANAMPPAGAPRPDAATYASLTAHIESELDRAADARPQVGGVPLVHRLSRTEYPERHSRSPGARIAAARGQHRLSAAAGQHQQRLRQYRGPALRVGEHDGALSGRRAEDQPSRCWRSVDASAREHLSSRSRASAGRACGRTALRNPRRSRGAERLSGGCHVHREGGDPGSLSASFPSPVPPREHGARHWRLAVRTSGSSMSPAMALF